MRCICSHATALWYWYLVGPAVLALARPFNGSLLDEPKHTAGPTPVPRLAEIGIQPCPASAIPCADPDDQLDLLISRRDSWRAPEGIRLHRWNGSLPAGSLHDVGSGILVCSPELALLQVSQALTDTQLIRLAMVLCGSYYIDQETDKVRERDPLTSIERICAMLDRAPGRRGVRRCRRLLAYAADGAASPTEIETYMLACLPPSFGGYGLDGSELNHKIELKGVDNRLLDRHDRQFVRVDLYWPESRAGIEYQAKDHDIAKDRRRLNMLASVGEKIFQVDAEQRGDVDRFDTTMAQLAHLMGRDLPDLTSEWIGARGMLRRELLGANRMRL